MALLRIPFQNMPEFLSAPPQVPSPSPPPLPPRPPPQSRQQRRHRRQGHCRHGRRKEEKRALGLRHDGVTDRLDQICKILGRLVDVIIEDKADRTFDTGAPLYRPRDPDRMSSEKVTYAAQRETGSPSHDSPWGPHHTTAASSPRAGAVIEDKLEEPRMSGALPLTDDTVADLATSFSWLRQDLTKAMQDLTALYSTAESAPAEAVRFAVRQLAVALSDDLDEALARLQRIDDRQDQAGLHEYLRSCPGAPSPPAVSAPAQGEAAVGSAAELPAFAPSRDRLPGAIVPTSLAPSPPGLAAPAYYSDTATTPPAPSYGATRNGQPTPVYPGVVNSTGALALDSRGPGSTDADWDIVEDVRAGRSGRTSRISL
ncbi:hypothetical protein F4809DRAFT_662706 [Biscogniauxia mediterranea]|nr:hypothetical protein F4809DRAFT_662706 [Biscogniauxia mediterranea]